MDWAQESFISSTFWTERIGPSAALATIEKFRRESIGDHLVAIGSQITNGWEDLAEDRGLSIKTKGLEPLTTFEFKCDSDQAAKTLFTQEMLDKGYLAGTSVYASFAHTPDVIDKYLQAVDDAFGTIAEAIQDQTVSDRLRGLVAHTKFERLN